MSKQNGLYRLMELGSHPLGQSISEKVSAETNSVLWKDNPILGQLWQMLCVKNGFFAFESALHVFGSGKSMSYSLEEWNSPSLWRYSFGNATSGLVFFAEDIFGDQFYVSKSDVGRFDCETAKTTHLANSIEAWAEMLIDDSNFQLAWRLGHAWQERNGPLPIKKRLIPKLPFILGGNYSVENLYAGDILQSMRARAELAMQIRDIPDGGQIRIVKNQLK